MPSGFTWKYAGSVMITPPRLRSMPSRSAAVSPKVRAKRRKRIVLLLLAQRRQLGGGVKPPSKTKRNSCSSPRASSAAEKVR